MDAKSMMIGALVVAVGVLGYLYYEETKGPKIDIDLPGVKIEGR